MAVFATWLADALRETGYPVVEVSGWKSRGSKGRGLNGVEGVTLHHTAGAKTGNYPSYNIVKNGRSDLPGPLAQVGLGRDGTWYVFAAGRANHAGTSSWAGFSNLNGSHIGIEAESAGYGKDWTDAEKDAYPRGVAAILKYARRSGSRAAGHKEICIPRGRKPDPAGINMDTLRRTVNSYLENPSTLRKGGIVGKPVATEKAFKVGERELKNTVPQMSGPDVVALQGWVGVKADGFYGPGTERAVRVVQKKVGVPVTGVVERVTWQHYGRWVKWRADKAAAAAKAAAAKPKPPTLVVSKPVLTVPAFATWTKGNGYFKKGDNSTAIAKWQRRMVERGYAMQVDGSFGPETDRIVRYFQNLAGLKANGLLGKDTWNAAWTFPVK